MAFRYSFKYSLDDPRRTMEHADIIKHKYFLRKLYTEWYHILLEEIPNLGQKKIVELGSGGGFLKELVPSVITSDYLDLPFNDMHFSALSMPFPNADLDAIFMIDTFHHIPDAQLFLEEASRTIRPKGKIIMIEPANSIWGRFIYKNFHHEPFDPENPDWKIPSSGPLSGANGALPWIVFERDFEQFKQKFPTLRLEKIQYHTPLIYLISGGLTLPQLVPGLFYRPIRTLDRFLANLFPSFSMFVTIVLSKN